MRPLSTTRFIPPIAFLNSFRSAKAVRTAFLHPFTKSALLLLLCMLLAANSYASQTETFSGLPALDTLGAHGNRGRECLVCHPPHNELPGLRAGVPSWMENNVPEAQGVHTASAASVMVGEAGNAVEVKPSTHATAEAEVVGVLLCLSCHDGSLIAENMLAGRSYEQIIGSPHLMRGPTVPSLLDEGPGDLLDHPLGVDAKIPTGFGLVFSNGIFSVLPKTPYAHFVEVYGMPTLAPSTRSNPYGIDAEGRPYLVCTTCHNQHVMSVYVSRPESPIASDQGYKSYVTLFFVNAPYGGTGGGFNHGKASSRAQFCRQCHFSFSNEANHSYFIPTQFQ